jgi:hypothetical protein
MREEHVVTGSVVKIEWSAASRRVAERFMELLGLT